MILARYAEALFWAGRQLERIESTARLVDLTGRNAMHHSLGEVAAEWRHLVELVGLDQTFDEHYAVTDAVSVTDFLFDDPDNPGSVCSVVGQLRENIRTARDRLPVEIWEEVNRLHLAFATRQNFHPSMPQDPEIHATVRRHCQAISGVIEEAMPRDEGHAFLVIGRNLERATCCTRALRFAWDRDEDPATLLRSVAALQAYRRHAGYDADRVSITSYLLGEPKMPRSVLTCIERAEWRLDDLGNSSRGIVVARRLAGRLRSDLEYGDMPAELEERGVEVLLGIEADLLRLGRVMADQAFDPAQGVGLQTTFVRPGTDNEE